MVGSFVDNNQHSLTMSRRSSLPDSLRWREVEWMEMGLPQTGTTKLLNVSHSVVRRLWDQYQYDDSQSRRQILQADHELQHLQKTFISLSVRRRRVIAVPQLVADHFVASERRISANTV
ncbi:HTH_Tnp_Tc3_2 domain-containing protein [Trichonephila clavipes]|nr:HTH_Tnp_Tc3_2 domain-containing protein [Trichonephila clavipes]